MNEGPRIVDLVFGRSHQRRRRTRVVLALVAGLGIHLVAAIWAVVSSPSLERWSAELATRVHAELTREEVVELPPPPVEKAKPMPPPPLPPEAPRPMARARRPRIEPPPSPAQAGKIVAAAPRANADPAAVKFVTGDAPTYAGGVTRKNGKSRTPVTGPVSYNGPPASTQAPAVAHEKDLSSQVALEANDWSCPWPREADEQEIDEQSVILRVLVRSDGSAESVSTLSDPGHGFAAAARACAMATRFTSARDRAGNAVRAESPPIRVHFTR